MGPICFALLSVVVGVLGDSQYLNHAHPVGLVGDTSNKVDSIDNGLADTDLLMAFAVFRHGDRTPDEEEMAKYPSEPDQYKEIFFPFGKKALTNAGKQRGFRVGEFLRKRYNGLISSLYLPDEVVIRTTDYARTKMTALTALAALFPPPPAQRWNPFLNWQPVPYSTEAYNDDDLMYYYNCPRYTKLHKDTYDLPEIKETLKQYKKVFEYLTEKTGADINTPEDAFFLDNLFQTLANVGVKPPAWADEVMPKIKELTKLEYATEYYNNELIRLSSGVLLAEVVNATNAAIKGATEQPKLRLYSAHENNVAGFMAAIGVFKPHQPSYGSLISLELRKKRSTGQYGVAAVYARTPEKPEEILPIDGCGGQLFCDYDRFITLSQDHILAKSEFKKRCTL